VANPDSDTISEVEEEACVFGVKKSLSAKRWLWRTLDERTALAISQRYGLPEIVGRILSARGVGLDDVESFLQPTLRDHLPDPAHLLDMERATERLAAAVIQGETLAVFGDYDVDGATSAALLRRFFSALGVKCLFYIPDRMKEGYGPNEDALMGLKDKGASVIVTVDCGTAAHGPLALAHKQGLDVIVVDHHKAEAKLPQALAVINPNRLDEESAHGQMAAVGVAFLLVVSVNRALDQAGWFSKRKKPNPLDWLDLVALGTVCDVAPLTGVNRAFVSQGLKVMAARQNLGLRVLGDVVGISEAPGVYHAGFVLGPRINAGGRIGESDLGVRLLSTEDETEAFDLSHKLDSYNQERRAIEASVLEEALDQVEKKEMQGVILVAGEGWHPGVIGIVAGRLKERFNRPALVVSLEGGKGQGSARSIGGFDLGSAIIAACQSKILEKGGGHAMAAGFSVLSDRLDDLERFLCQRLEQAGDGDLLRPSLHLDGAIKIEGASIELVETLSRLEPFGVGNASPRFAIEGVRLSSVRVVGENHLSITLAGAAGGRLSAMAFRALETDMGQALLHHDGASFHLAGRLKINRWRGRETAQFQIDDAAPSWG
jgi:single-stranded-DNA-specific exonuclease